MSWLDCLHQPMFQSYRERWPWNKNELQPCPMLENPGILPAMVKEADAKSTEYVSPEGPEKIMERTVPYAKEWAPVAKKLWEDEHPTGEKYDGASADVVATRSKLIRDEDKERDAVLD